MKGVKISEETAIQAFQRKKKKVGGVEASNTWLLLRSNGKGKEKLLEGLLPADRTNSWKDGNPLRFGLEAPFAKKGDGRDDCLIYYNHGGLTHRNSPLKERTQQNLSNKKPP